jgi:hypothetical protein
MTPNTFTQRGVPGARPVSARESRLGNGSAMACLGPVIVTGRQFTKHCVDVKSKRSGGGGAYTRLMPRLWNETIEAHRREVREATLDATAELVAKHGLRCRRSPSRRASDGRRCTSISKTSNRFWSPGTSAKSHVTLNSSRTFATRPTTLARS